MSLAVSDPGTSRDRAIDLTCDSRSASPSPIVIIFSNFNPSRTTASPVKIRTITPNSSVKQASPAHTPSQNDGTAKPSLRKATSTAASRSPSKQSKAAQQKLQASAAKLPRRIASAVKLSAPLISVSQQSSSRSTSPASCSDHSDSDSDIQIVKILQKPMPKPKEVDRKGKGRARDERSNTPANKAIELARTDETGTLVLSPKQEVPASAIVKRQYMLPPSPVLRPVSLFPKAKDEEIVAAASATVEVVVPSSSSIKPLPPPPVVVVPPPPVVALLPSPQLKRKRRGLSKSASLEADDKPKPAKKQKTTPGPRKPVPPGATRPRCSFDGGIIHPVFKMSRTIPIRQASFMIDVPPLPANVDAPLIVKSPKKSASLKITLRLPPKPAAPEPEFTFSPEQSEDSQSPDSALLTSLRNIPDPFLSCGPPSNSLDHFDIGFQSFPFPTPVAEITREDCTSTEEELSSGQTASTPSSVDSIPNFEEMFAGLEPPALVPTIEEQVIPGDQREEAEEAVEDFEFMDEFLVDY